jgi:hypothetical protein
MKIVRRRSLFRSLAAESPMQGAPMQGVPIEATSKPIENEQPKVVHIHPFAKGIHWDGIQHGGPPWRGVCIAGLWVGTHFFPRKGVVLAVSGVFGRVGHRPGLLRTPCKNPVKFRCRLMHGGKVLPMWWLSCGDPNHMNHAAIIEHLDARGFVTETEYVTPSNELESPEVEELSLPAAVKPPPLLPQNGGSRRGWAKNR